jgi:hypothetical protein
MSVCLHDSSPELPDGLIEIWYWDCTLKVTEKFNFGLH